MKIAEISAFANYSVGNIMKDIQSYFLKEGHECMIFYAREKVINQGLLLKYGNDVVIKINALMARFLDNDGFFDFYDTKKLIKYLNEYDPDIIHIHCLHGYHINVRKLFSFFEKKGKKIVWTMHDAWAFTGHCCYYKEKQCYKWKFFCHNCPNINSYPKSLFLDRTKTNFLAKKKIFNSINKANMLIVSPSKWMNDNISESFLKEYRHIIINNGVSTSLFKDYKKTRSKTLLAVASVWDARKNLEYVLSIAKNIGDWNIIIVGKVNRQQLKKINKIKNIRYIKRTKDRNELVKLYNESSIFINPTLDENFPTVNIEAQLCGLKVLSFDTGGCKETDIGGLFLINEQTKINGTYLDEVAKKNISITTNSLSKENMACMYYKIIRGFFENEEI